MSLTYHIFTYSLVKFPMLPIFQLLIHDSGEFKEKMSEVLAVKLVEAPIKTNCITAQNSVHSAKSKPLFSLPVTRTALQQK